MNRPTPLSDRFYQMCKKDEGIEAMRAWVRDLENFEAQVARERVLALACIILLVVAYLVEVAK